MITTNAYPEGFFEWSKERQDAHYAAHMEDCR